MSMISQLLNAYLVGYVYWLDDSAGLRRPILMNPSPHRRVVRLPIGGLLEAVPRTFGLMAILFIPVSSG